MQLQNNSLTNSWLKLGIISLSFGGLYSIILVILRTPQLSIFFPNPHIFKSALIIHVNLSVLIWLLSITASIWSSKTSLQGTENAVAISKNLTRLPRPLCGLTMTYNIYPRLAFLATFLIAISPAAGHNPVMNNYIPMLENIIFIIGLSLFGVTLLLYSINILYFFDWSNWSNLINFTIFSTIIMFLLTWICFGCSYSNLQDIIQIIPIEIEFYYELLFWSGGHLLQFIYTQIVMFIWIILLAQLVTKELKFQKFFLFLLYLNFVFGILTIFGHIFYDVIDGVFKEFYTNHMKYLGGISPILCLVGMLLELVLSRRGLRTRSSILNSAIKLRNDNNTAITNNNFIKTTLLCSITLFLFGGLISINISGINVVIPAHYHGMVVGISIAYMGYCYLNIGDYKSHCERLQGGRQSIKTKFFTRLLRRFFKSPRNDNVINFTFYLLTFGQILHILGLALAGGYGVMRKDPSALMPLSAKLLMGMMGGGGLIAIVGGLMFVFICGKTILFKSNKNYDI